MTQDNKQEKADCRAACLPPRHGSGCDVAAVSNEAAQHAVKKVFAILGVDIDRPESVEEFRADLRFGRRMRKIADHSTLAFAAVVTAAFAAAVWAGIVSKLNGGQ